MPLPAPGRHLAGEFARAVFAERAGGVAFAVGRLARRIRSEDVVAADLNEERIDVAAGVGEGCDGMDVCGPAGSRLGLGFVDGRPGGAVDHGARPEAADDGANRRRVGDVEAAPRQRRGAGPEQPAQHPPQLAR